MDIRDRDGPVVDNGRPLTTDEVGLLADLEASDRFVKDSAIGRMFHPGRCKVSYREAVRENSLHVVVDGHRVSAHIDSVSPLVFQGDGRARYSLLRAMRYSLPLVVVHNLSSLIETVWRACRGLGNSHRCELVCERVALDAPDVGAHLHEPEHEPADAGLPACAAPAQPPADAADAEVQHVPFNVVDEAIDLLDTSSSPWSVQVEARVAGRLDEDRLRRALAAALSRHPRGRSRKRPGGSPRGYKEWEVAAEADLDALETVECPDDASLDAARARLQSTPVPLTASPPVRAQLARSPDGDVLMLHLNHVATDGFGGLRLLHSVARAYRGAPDPLADDSPLADRTLPVRLADVGASARLRRRLALAERLRDLLAPPARLAPAPAAPAEGNGGGYGFHHTVLGRQQTGWLTNRDRAGSVNDALVASLHLAVAEWNRRHGAPCRRITVMVPANLRPPRWRGEVVGNFSLPARVTTGPRQRRSAASTLEAVVAQTKRKKRTGMGTALLELLDRSQRLPLGVKRAMVAAMDRAGGRFIDTAILSNLGVISDPPSFGEEAGQTGEMWFSAPGRMPLGLSVGALTLDGRLHLVVRSDRDQFDDAATREFADVFCHQLRRVAAIGGEIDSHQAA